MRIPIIQSLIGYCWRLGELGVRDRTPLVTVPLAVLVSAAIAYALVFWTPLFKPKGDWYYSEGFKDSYSYDGASFPDITDLKKLQPQEFQGVVQGLFNDLVKLSEGQLYVLSALDGDDVCRSKLFECVGVPGKHVKPFIEKALSHKQTRIATEIAAGSLDTAKLSLAVAFAAFLVSMIGVFVKMKG